MTRKFILAATAALAVATPAAIPAIAQASFSTSFITRNVQRQYSREVRNRARLIGWRTVSVQVHCAHDTGRYYSCYGKSTLARGRQRQRYGVFINVVGRRWTAGRSTLLRVWRV